MLYEVKDCETGEIVEIERPIAEAPPFGVEFCHNGRRMLREVSFPAIRMAHGTDRTGSVKAWSMPRKGSTFWDGVPDAPHYDKDGFAVFRGQREIDRWLAKGGGKKMMYDKSMNQYDTDTSDWDGAGKKRKIKNSSRRKL